MAVVDETRGVIWLEEVLGAIADFGAASLELVAWELSLREEAVLPAWQDALIRGLIVRAGTDPDTGEKLFRISVPPESRLI